MKPLKLLRENNYKGIVLTLLSLLGLLEITNRIDADNDRLDSVQDYDTIEKDLHNSTTELSSYEDNYVSSKTSKSKILLLAYAR